MDHAVLISQDIACGLPPERWSDFVSMTSEFKTKSSQECNYRFVERPLSGHYHDTGLSPGSRCHLQSQMRFTSAVWMSFGQGICFRDEWHDFFLIMSKAVLSSTGEERLKTAEPLRTSPLRWQSKIDISGSFNFVLSGLFRVLSLSQHSILSLASLSKSHSPVKLKSSSSDLIDSISAL